MKSEYSPTLSPKIYESLMANIFHIINPQRIEFITKFMKFFFIPGLFV